uniref:uncharacterized protein LOC118528919 n=1 Tax=Halichoerus grypus TaxID=9711 RepID=UPI0016596CF6|nr:uncharacterized protein LOC118528919 [Halichoerus grypus]
METPSLPPDRASSPHPPKTSLLLPAPHPYTEEAVGRTRWGGPIAHSHSRSACTRGLQPVVGHVRPAPLLGPLVGRETPRLQWQPWGPDFCSPAHSQEVGTAAAVAGASGSAPPYRGQRDRGLRAPPLLHPWLRAPLGPDPLRSGARAPCCLPFPLCRRPAGSSPWRDACSILLLRLYGFPGAKNFASVPTSISWPLSPSPRDSPTPWARARTLTHIHTRRRACARPHARAPRAAESPADPTLSGAATHTGFQSPRGVLCLRQRRRRQQREPQRQLGRVLQLRARDGVREKRRRRTPRRGGAAPRPAPGSRLRAAGCPRSRYRGSRILKAA